MMVVAEAQAAANQSFPILAQTGRMGFSNSRIGCKPIRFRTHRF